MLLAGAICVTGQPADTINRHVIWEKDFPNLHSSVLENGVCDAEGFLWLMAGDQMVARLVRIDPTRQVLTAFEMAPAFKPEPPADMAYYRLAVSPAGRLAVLARYFHWVGRAMYCDGAKFALLARDGVSTAPRAVAGPAAEYKGFFALSDEHFMIMGDQEPMVVIRVGPAGDPTWHHTFSENWVNPTGAALEDGASCIVSPAYGAPQLHLIRLSSSGVLQSRVEIAAQRAEVAAGPGGRCAVLYDREPALRRGEFFLTSLDATFKREWTAPVTFPAPQGGVFQLIALQDGYVVVAMANDGLFLAKYRFDGQLAWSALDPSRRYADFAVASGENFYLIGAGPKENYLFHVVFAR
jgi:hypothetical protein